MVPEQETGKENTFVFGMDAEDVPAWREGKRLSAKDAYLSESQTMTL